MNRPDTGTQTDDLPTFLDEGSDATAATATTAATETLDASEGSGAESSTAETADETLPDQPESTPPPGRRSSIRRTEARAGGGGLAIAAGCALLLSAAGLGLTGPDSTLPGKLDRFGLTPASLVVLGAVLAAAGSTRARIAALHRRLDASNGTGNDLQQSLATLLDAQQATADRAPAAGEDQQQLLVTLQRQDDKIVNLTKALKMYGKPIMEIAAQGTELAAGMAQVRTAADASLESSRQAFARLETQLRSGTVTKQSIDELHDAVRKVATAVEAAASKTGAMPSLEPLQQQIARTEVAVQAVAQRLEHSDVQKSLLRLEDTTQKARGELQQLLRGESVDRAATRLQERLDQATSRLHDGLCQMREGNLGPLATSVREIQREVASVATSVAQIQAAVRASGGRIATGPTAPATVQPAPTASPAPATSTAPTGTAPTAATAAATTSPAAAAAPAGDASVGGYQTGTRTTNSKNVLGAIAKLKQMKG